MGCVLPIALSDWMVLAQTMLRASIVFSITKFKIFHALYMHLLHFRAQRITSDQPMPSSCFGKRSSVLDLTVFVALQIHIHGIAARLIIGPRR